MLSDPIKFQTVEQALASMGVIERFERENGAIKGRMMIVTTEIPDAIPVQREDRENLTAFEASFDFYNVAIGVVADTKKKTLESSVWGRNQAEGAVRPSQEWIRFFIQTLLEHIDDDGNFGVPMYSFVNDTSDFTAVPTAAPDSGVIEAEFREEKA